MRSVPHQPRPVPPVYRRRRLAVGAVATAVVVSAFNLVASSVGSEAGAPDVQPAAQRVHVAQPGDTLWTIARDINRAGDIRATVDRLAALNGGPDLRVGQRVVLP